MLLQVGILCNSLPRTDAAVSAGGREECDHMRLLVDMMNDKADGFLDDILPNAHVCVAAMEGAPCSLYGTPHGGPLSDRYTWL